MAVFIYSTDIYIKKGVCILADYCLDDIHDVFFIDLGAFPGNLSLQSLLQKDGRIIFLTPDRYNLSLLAYVCGDFQGFVFSLPRKSNLIELALTLRNTGKDITLNKLNPSFTPAEQSALKAFLEDVKTGPTKKGIFPPPSDMGRKKASYYRQKLSDKLGFRNSIDFYLGLSELAFIY